MSYNLLDQSPGKTSNFKIFFGLLILVSLYFLFVANKNAPRSPIFEAFRNCAYPKLAPLRGDYKTFWHQFVNLTEECDTLEIYKKFDLRDAKNDHELKRVAYPKKNDTLTMVTFGIGHDVSGEQRLKMMYPKIEFYGVDPSSYLNRDLYETDLGGKYFEYAISGESGMKRSMVFGKNTYQEEVHKTVAANYFFKDVIGKSKIDILWMDVEGHEYPILEWLVHQNDVKICQINIEMHKDTFKKPIGEMEKFHDFVFQVLEDGKYVMMKPVFVHYMEMRFIRTFIVNVADKECTDLFVDSI